MYLPAPDEALHTVTLRVLLQIPGARSLKDRRRVVLSVRDRAMARHGVAAAEVGHLDNPKAAVLAFAVVGNDRAVLQARLDTLLRDVEAVADAVLVDVDREVVAFRASEGLPRRPRSDKES